MRSRSELHMRAQEPLDVQRRAAREPRCVWLRADEKKKMTDRPCALLARRNVPPADRMQSVALAFQSTDLGLGQHFDIGERRDALDEITRHARYKARPANDHPT